MPRVTFIDPEVATVGLTEDEARDHGLDVRPLTVRQLGKARALGETEGFVKVVLDAGRAGWSAPRSSRRTPATCSPS